MRGLIPPGICVLVLLAATSSMAGQAAVAKPALAAVVTEVEGTVETRPAVGQPWVPVKVGMTLAEGADLRSGFRARCVLDMTDSLVQVDPLTVVRIAQLQEDGGTVRTRLSLKQGNTQSAVEKGRIPSDFAIVTPSATLSVRGTRGIQCRYFPDTGGEYALMESGLIAVADRQTGREAGVRPGEDTDDEATQPIQMVIDRHLSPVIDSRGTEQAEKEAAVRWRGPSLTPAALNGSDDYQRGLHRGQEKNHRTDIKEEKIKKDKIKP